MVPSDGENTPSDAYAAAANADQAKLAEGRYAANTIGVGAAAAADSMIIFSKSMNNVVVDVAAFSTALKGAIANLSATKKSVARHAVAARPVGQRHAIAVGQRTGKTVRLLLQSRAKCDSANGAGVVPAKQEKEGLEQCLSL